MAKRRRHTPATITPERRDRIKEVLDRRQADLTVVLENIHDPHNYSAVLRSCDAVGVMNVALLYHSGQVKPDAKRSSSAGAGKWIRKHTFRDIDACFAALRARGMRIYTTGLTTDAVSLYELDLTRPTALVFGNEHDGVSRQAIEQADGNFLIPQVGMIQSLNISVACAVTLFEAYRQRDKAGMYAERQLTDAEYAALLEQWADL